MPKRIGLALCAALGMLLAAPGIAQYITAAPPPIPEGITVESPLVPGPSLEGNLEGNATAREAMIVLPPGYGSNPDRRYPVVYYLPGVMIDARNFYNYMHIPEAVAHNATAGREFIVVVPNPLTKMGGSMYANSVTVGDFESYVAKDLVAYVDSHYRTIATREGRALVGHSMGGYGTWTIGMRQPGIFAALYAQDACCISPRRETVESAQQLADVPYDTVEQAGMGQRIGLTAVTAWSPNPDNPPYYADFPIKDGKLDEIVLARWANNSPVAMLPTHLEALRGYTAIGADVGDKDFLLADDTLMHEEMLKFGIEHRWEIYPGTHTDKIGQRFDEVVLPFMAEHLDMGSE